jgi:hypothetical protein
MYLDPSVLQSKTVSKIVDVLKLARTITKGGSNYNNKINIMIEEVVELHRKAALIPKIGKKPETSPFLRNYKVNL